MHEDKLNWALKLNLSDNFGNLYFSSWLDFKLIVKLPVAVSSQYSILLDLLQTLCSYYTLTRFWYTECFFWLVGPYFVKMMCFRNLETVTLAFVLLLFITFSLLFLRLFHYFFPFCLTVTHTPHPTPSSLICSYQL